MPNPTALSIPKYLCLVSSKICIHAHGVNATFERSTGAVYAYLKSVV